MKIHLRFAFTALSLMLFLGCRPALGQNGGQDSQHLTQQNAANSWRFVGIDPAKQTDTADPETRQARTAFWANTLGRFLPHPGGSPAISHGSFLGTTPEIVRSPDDLWATGTFVSYQVFPIPSIQLAYTEIQFLVQSVISANPPAGVAPGKMLTIGHAGGTLLEGGKQVSYWLSPERYSLQPGHTYLIQLNPVPGTNFFLAGAQWDITGGTAVPNEEREAVLAQKGKSQISGTPSSKIVQRMKAILAAQ